VKLTITNHPGLSAGFDQQPVFYILKEDVNITDKTGLILMPE
jgi:hypothetical protein